MICCKLIILSYLILTFTPSSSSAFTITVKPTTTTNDLENVFTIVNSASTITVPNVSPSLDSQKDTDATRISFQIDISNWKNSSRRSRQHTTTGGSDYLSDLDRIQILLPNYKTREWENVIFSVKRNDSSQHYWHGMKRILLFMILLRFHLNPT